MITQFNDISEAGKKAQIDKISDLEIKLGETQITDCRLIYGYHKYGIGFVTVDKDGKIFNQDMKPIGSDFYKLLKEKGQDYAKDFLKSLYRESRNFSSL